MSRIEPRFSLREIAELIDGELLFPTERMSARGVHDFDILSVTIDSRTVSAGAFFVPLPGTHTDGHEFIETAAEAGASGAFVNAAEFDKRRVELLHLLTRFDFALFVVRDVLAALQDVSRYYLGKAPTLFRIGITGSNGKTTTKEMVAAILRTVDNTFASAGNYNSEIGLPLSILALDPANRYGVFEMAMNHRGEMRLLADILRPDAAMVTNIGAAHIGMIGSRDGIAEEKKKIFSRFNGNQDAFIPEDDDYREFLAHGVTGRIHYFGQKSTDGFESSEELGIEGSTIRWNGRAIRLSLPGAHNVRNALGAISIASMLSIPADAIQAGLESVHALFGRNELLRGRVTVLQDCYNANPDSMLQSLQFLSRVAWQGRKIAVLGEMAELGDFAETYHRELGTKIAEQRIDALFLFGEAMRAVQAELNRTEFKGTVEWFSDFDLLRKRLHETTRSGDIVLLKGSRSTGLEALTPELVS